MNDEAELMARVQDLESRLAWQDDAIERLSGVLHEQWSTIGALSRRIELLEQRLADVEDRAPLAPEAPPPHY